MSVWSGFFGRRKVKLTDPDAGAISPSSKAGKAVTPDSALSLSTAWACVRLISETIATLPLGVYRKTPSGRQAAQDHRLYRLLHDSPNADQTAAEFWEGMVASLCLWGNAYARKVMEGGRVIALEPIRADGVTVVRDANGRRVYVVRPASGARAEELDEDVVFHIRGFGVGGDVGLSPISYARESLGGALAADEAAASLLANGLQQPLWIDSGQATLRKEQRDQIRAMIAKFTGSSNAGKIFVGEAGMKPVPLAFSPDDAQFLQTRAFQVEDICRWFRVPPFMVGHTEKSTSWGTGLESQGIGFLTYALRPYLTRIEQAGKKQLMGPADRADGLYLEFAIEGLLRADSQARAEYLSKKLQNGSLTPNEWRELDNQPPVDGGDQALVNSTLVPLVQVGAPRGPAVAVTPPR